MLAAILICGASVFTACSSNDDNPFQPVVQVGIDKTNFPDDNFWNYLLEQDYGKDGVLTEAEIRNITVMDVSEKDIKSLKGIECRDYQSAEGCIGRCDPGRCTREGRQGGNYLQVEQ